MRSTRRGVPKYDDTDDFLLLLPGGQSVELVEKTTEGALTRWIPQVEEAFLRVVQKTDNTWEVWDKGGTKFIFGGPPPVGAPPGSLPGRVGSDINQASGTFGWYLTRIEDPNGNTLEITYLAIAGETSGTYVYPSRIDYGANPGASFSHKHHLIFTWEVRPDLLESDSGGYLSRMSRRLQKIEVSTC